MPNSYLIFIFYMIWVTQYLCFQSNFSKFDLIGRWILSFLQKLDHSTKKKKFFLILTIPLLPFRLFIHREWVIDLELRIILLWKTRSLHCLNEDSLIYQLDLINFICYRVFFTFVVMEEGRRILPPSPSVLLIDKW